MFLLYGIASVHLFLLYAIASGSVYQRQKFRGLCSGRYQFPWCTTDLLSQILKTIGKEYGFFCVWCVCICSYVFMCCVCMCICKCSCMFVLLQTCRGQNIFFNHFSTLWFYKVSHWTWNFFHQSSWPTRPKDPSVSTSLALGLQPCIIVRRFLC